MPDKLSDLSLAELRRRYGGAEAAVSSQVLSRLRRDPRGGARQLYRTLRRRQERRRQEAQRLEAMLHFERVLWQTGRSRVAGVDEAGVGPLAGPVVAAAVMFPAGSEPAAGELAAVDDSKRLDAATREALAAAIRRRAAVGVGIASVAEIDRVNVYQAGLLAMRRAVEALDEPPQHLLVDARQVPGVDIPQNPFEKGDGLNFSIAAASIIAKTHRDALMTDLDREHPTYGFARHKGYSTAEHMEAIRCHGPCDAHRLSYPVLRELCGEFSEGFYALRQRLSEAADRPALRRLEGAVEEAGEALAEDEVKKLRLLLRRAWERQT